MKTKPIYSKKPTNRIKMKELATIKLKILNKLERDEIMAVAQWLRYLAVSIVRQERYKKATIKPVEVYKLDMSDIKKKPIAKLEYSQLFTPIGIIKKKPNDNKRATRKKVITKQKGNKKVK